MIKIIKSTMLLVIASGALIILFVRLFYGSNDLPTYHVFMKHSEGYYLHKLFGILPKSYENRYSQILLDSFSNIRVLSLIDYNAPSQNEFILILKGEDIKVLKAYPKVFRKNLSANVEPVIWDNHVSLLVDIEAFNDYISLKKLQSKAQIIEQYCNFLAPTHDRWSYRILRNLSDLDLLIKDIPLNNTDYLIASGHELIKKDDIDFVSNDNFVYCWLIDKGVVKFDFLFNNENQIKSIRSEIIGVLGNENPSI